MIEIVTRAQLEVVGRGKALVGRGQEVAPMHRVHNVHIHAQAEPASTVNLSTHTLASCISILYALEIGLHRFQRRGSDESCHI